MAEALVAFRKGEDSDLAFTGAMVLARGLSDLSVCRQFAISYAKALAGDR
jgi:hypothetical protein